VLDILFTHFLVAILGTLAKLSFDNLYYLHVQTHIWTQNGILEKRLQAAIILHDEVKFLEEFCSSTVGTRQCTRRLIPKNKRTTGSVGIAGVLFPLPAPLPTSKVGEFCGDTVR
jgi:hypothetical protein